MATVAAPQPASARLTAGAHDRLFYGAMAIAMAVTVFAGFAPSYFLRAVLAGPLPPGTPELSPLLHVHGAVFTAWVVLFVVQTALVASRRVRMHRRLGMAGAALAAVMVAVGVSAALDAARRGAAPPGLDPRVFLAIPLGDMVTFSVFVAAAIGLRRKKEAHKRLMLLAFASLLAAAVARLPGVIALGPIGFYGLAILPVLTAGILYDWASRRKVHPVYLWGGALLVVSVPARLLLSKTSSWLAFADRVTG